MKDEKAVRPISIRTGLALLLFLGPLFLGMFGAGTWFIPNQQFRGAAAAVGIAYYAAFWACRSKLRGTGAGSADSNRAILVLGILMCCYFSYVAFYITIPAGITEVFGSPSHRQYVIAGIQPSTRKAWLCPYRVKLVGVRTVFSDSLCADASFVERISPGENVRFAGKESVLGFRVFDNAR